MKYRISALLLVAMLLAGCEYESYKEYRHPPYEGLFEWTEITSKAQWSNRLDHTALWFDDQLWVMGGYNPGKVSGDPYMEDVWSSADGESWTLVSEDAPWKGRRGHASVVYDDGSGQAMYVIGGFTVDEETGYREYTNDVWKSSDGAQWSRIKERDVPPLDSLYDWYPRYNHACVVAEHEGTKYIYLVGGTTQIEDHYARYAMKYFNDVWRSSDGVHWEQLPNTDFGIRAEHALVVDPLNQRLYMQGGRHGEIIQNEAHSRDPHPEFNWLWYSDDGISWESVNDTAEFDQKPLQRTEHQLVVMDNRIFGFPGRSSSNHHVGFSGTWWRLDDGLTWSIDSEGSDFNRRHSYPVVVHEEGVWVLGGETADRGPDNDVWYGKIK